MQVTVGRIVVKKATQGCRSIRVTLGHTIIYLGVCKTKESYTWLHSRLHKPHTVKTGMLTAHAHHVIFTETRVTGSL